MKLTDKQKRIIVDLEYASPAQFLFHFPNRYEISENKDIQDWEIGDKISIEANLASDFRRVRFARNRTVTNFEVSFQNELVKVTTFIPFYLKASNFEDGILITGKVEESHKIIAQSVSTIKDIGETLIKPVYSSKQHIKQYEISRLMRKLLDHIHLKDVVPEDYQKSRELIARQDAIETLHFPKTVNALNQAIHSIKYEEFLMYHLSSAYEYEQFRTGIVRSVKESLEIENLPFTLRADQDEAYKTILNDFNSSDKMQRLLQGDVGSGKTVVAFLAALSMIEQGYQTAFMVPTELLLFQHIATFEKLFPDVEYAVIQQDSDQEAYDQVEKGSVKMVFGTHSLFQKKMKFNNLGFIIIDEQHRFGVKQREALSKKGSYVDSLMLSATPIPQTLAQSLFLDLDVSTLSHSRKNKVETHLIYENSIRSILPDLNETLKRKEQIYVVCPAIEEGEKTNIRNVSDIHKSLSKEFNNYQVVMLHGRMTTQEKEAVLEQFANGSIDILVSTSVIEVGIDVHNATSIVIYNAEQFGLATLHQMRGRVGRGDVKGNCYILSSQSNEDSQARLEALVEHDDGFVLSQIDLKQRGMGDLLGLRQSGLPQFYLASIYDDIEILEKSKEDATELMKNIENYPVLEKHIQRLVENRRKEKEAHDTV